MKSELLSEREVDAGALAARLRAALTCEVQFDVGAAVPLHHPPRDCERTVEPK